MPQRIFPWFRPRYSCFFCRQLPYCSPLVKELAKMREAWKHINLPIVRALDKAMHDVGFGAEQMCALGYVVSEEIAKQAIRRSSRKWRMKSKGGRPSKVKDPQWQSLVKEALDIFPQAPV